MEEVERERREQQQRRRHLEQNLSKLIVFQALRGFMIMMPIIVLFFTSVGLSMQDIMVSQAVFSVMMVLFEIPSGYFSDVWGRRQTLLAGSILTTAGFALYCFADGFIVILIAEAILGVGMAFISGTDSALLFDTLAELGQTERSIQSEGRQLSYGNFAESVAGIIGGLLAAISLRVPLYAQVAVIALCIPLTWSLTEPRRHSFHNQSGSLRGIIEISHSALIRDVRLRWFLLFSGVIGSATLTMVWFIQPYMLSCGLPVQYFGFAWTAFNLSVGTFSMRAHTLESRFSERTIVTLMLGAVCAGFILCASFNALWSIPFVLFFYFVRGINNPIFNTYINRLVTGDRRATVLSIRQLVTRGVFCITGPLSGMLADRSSQSTALAGCAALFFVAGSALLLVRPNTQLTPESGSESESEPAPKTA